MLDSLIAVFLVIATGWLLKVRNIVTPAHWIGVERLTYQVLFPAVVIHTLAMADLRSVPVAAMGMSLVLAILSIAALLLLLRPSWHVAASPVRPSPRSSRARCAGTPSWRLRSRPDCRGAPARP